MRNVIIDCKNINKKYGKKTVLKDVDFQSKKGVVTGLLGPNGAGKSTLFKVILGLVVPNSGEIYLDGLNISHLPIHKRALSGLAYLPQEPSVFRNLTVIDNLQMIANLLKIEDSDRKISSIIKDFGLDNLENQYAYSLSGWGKEKVRIC